MTCASEKIIMAEISGHISKHVNIVIRNEKIVFLIYSLELEISGVVAFVRNCSVKMILRLF